MSQRSVWKLSLVALLGCLLSGAVVTPVRSQGLGEQLGAELDRGLDRLGKEFREGWQSLRKTVDQMGVQGRVYSRLRWDKQLAGAQLEIEVAQGGLVELLGRVPSDEAKQKAVQLAQDTVGVQHVVDHLVVGADAPTATDAPTPEE